MVMTKGRLEAFSDGVIAILITIMVLELRVPEGVDLESLHHLLPEFCTYVLSFTFLGIYWNNHHHMMHMVDRVTGGILWANLHLLFWLSLVTFATQWMGANDTALVPTVVYGVVLLAAAFAYYTLQLLIIRSQGPGSKLRAAIGSDLKGKMSPILYSAAIGSAFVHVRIAQAMFLLVALIWLIPDRRLERHHAITGS